MNDDTDKKVHDYDEGMRIIVATMSLNRLEDALVNLNCTFRESDFPIDINSNR